MCQMEFDARAKDLRKGYGKYCSLKCSARKGGLIKSEKYNSHGENNPNWKGGISKNNYHYKKIQKKRYPEKIRAREKVRYALKTGKLVKESCLKCGNTETFAHHTDYGKPLEIMWLCRLHHREEHGNRY